MGTGIKDEANARCAAIHLTSISGVHLDDAHPIVDGTPPGGMYLYAVLAPVSGSDTLIFLRVLGTRRLGISDLAVCGALLDSVGTLLQAFVTSRTSVLVSGAAGSGRAALLSTAFTPVPASGQIICIEEVTEITPIHPRCVYLIERTPNVEEGGAIILTDLVRATVRVCLDHLVLGRCRGPEVRDVLAVLSIGRDGG